jgi:hypothetical protein
MRRINGIPTDGAEAYKNGILAGECPYMEEDPEFDRWNREWDDAADEHEAEVAEAARPKVGSIITNRYRATYAEQGHPTHCGDELATVLNTLCANKGGTNIELFVQICSLNGLDLTKYNRISKGWQGRLRMTGRNLLAKKVREQGGRLYLPFSLGGAHQLGQEWIEQAEVKYKPKRVA